MVASIDLDPVQGSYVHHRYLWLQVYRSERGFQKIVDIARLDPFRRQAKLFINFLKLFPKIRSVSAHIQLREVLTTEFVLVIQDRWIYGVVQRNIGDTPIKLHTSVLKHGGCHAI